MYVYIQTEPGLWTVGFYDPSDKFIAESDHSDREKAADRVAYLNGGSIDEDNSCWDRAIERNRTNG